MTIRRNRYTAWLAVLLLTAGFASCQQDEFAYPERHGGTGDGSTLRFISDPMDALKVTTRSSDIKDDEEKAIKQLYIFFFGSDGEYLKGGYLTGYEDAAKEGGFYAPGEGVSMIKISNGENMFTDRTKAAGATVYALANVEEGTFTFSGTNGEGLPDQIANEKAMKEFIYKPKQAIILGLPETGMPMFGSRKIDLTSSTNEEDRMIELEALMARVDVSISINSSNSGQGQGGTLPSLTLMDWTARGLPNRVALAEPAADAVTGWDDQWNTEIQTTQTRVLYNKTGSIDMTFYMFENLQAAIDPRKVDWTKVTTDGNVPSLNEDGYPAGTKETQYQLYKPFLAKDGENSAAVELHGYYSTYNNTPGEKDATYEVTYTLYLGSNHTDNFQVKRNHQYKNNIVIKGLTQVGTNPEHITFDARVNIKEEDNAYFISMLRERDHDAHFCVTPMDVYLFRNDAEYSPTMEVILGEVPDGSETPDPETVPDWIRMEKVSSDDMQNGTLNTESLSADTHCNAGSGYHAGHGKRKYFTVDLVTKTLANNTRVTLDKSRDRVYFYLDEYLEAVNSLAESDAKRRTCTVTLIYKEHNEEVSRRTIQIEQVPLLAMKIDIYEKEGVWPFEHEEYKGSYTIYMEQFEEYLQHYDPLDEYSTDALFEGIMWGPGGEVGKPRSWAGWGSYPESHENYYGGTKATRWLVEEAFPNIDGGNWSLNDLNTKVKCAAQYCYNKGKRKSDGSMPRIAKVTSDNDYYGDEGIGVEWFLPGVTEMEDALEHFYNSYNEFKNYFYWSSAAGKRDIIIDIIEDENYARAIKIDENGNYLPNNESSSSLWPNGGKVPRDNESVRIRAFRRTLNPVSAD